MIEIADLEFPDEHVAWQEIIAADPEYGLPFAVHVVIFHTRDQLAAACKSPEAGGHSVTYREPDESGVGAAVFLNKEMLELSIVAHEAAHVALFWERNHNDPGRIGARRWLEEHPETLVDSIGNITAFIWFRIPDAGEL